MPGSRVSVRSTIPPVAGKRPSCNREVAEALAGAVTGHVAPALPAPRPLALQGTTRAPPVALPLHPTIPVTSTNLTMSSRAQDCASAPAELRSSAVAFTPGEKVHMTPVKVSTPAAEDEDELCAWLREKACLHKVVIEKSLWASCTRLRPRRTACCI